MIDKMGRTARLYIEVNAPAGVSLLDAYIDCRQLAEKLGIYVHLKGNDFTFIARPEDTEEAMRAAYERGYLHNRDKVVISRPEHARIAESPSPSLEVAASSPPAPSPMRPAEPEPATLHLADQAWQSALDGMRQMHLRASRQRYKSERWRRPLRRALRWFGGFHG